MHDSSSTPLLIIQFLFFALGGILIVTLSVRNVLKTVGNKKNALHDLANNLGITTLGGDPFFPSVKWLSWLRKPILIDDQWQGHRLRIDHETRGGDKNRTIYATIKLYLSETKSTGADVRMTISAVGWMSNLGINLGRKPLETGDAVFDKQFVVKAHDDDFANMILLPELRAELLRVWDESDVKGTLRIEREWVYYEEVGRLRTDAQVRRFESLVRIMNTIATAIDVARSM